MRRFLAAVVTLVMLAPFAAFAQERPMLPKGRWWKMPEVAKRLDLTPEQQAKLDDLFTQRSKELIDLKATMEKAAIELRSSLENYDTKPADVMKYATAVGSARGELFKKEIEMMLDIRAELSEEQWTKLRQALDQHMENRMRDSRRPGQRPSPPQNRNQ